MSRNRTRNRPNSVSNTNQTGTSAESQIPTDSNEQTDEVDVNNEQTEQEQQAPMEVVADDLTGATQTPVEKEETAEPEKAEETEVPQETSAPEETIQVVTAPPVEQAEVSEEEEEEVPVSSTTVFPEDNANVVKLKEILKELKEALSAYGKTPEEFAAAAKLHSSLVRHVVNNARPEIFDVVLAFYEENIDGVCDPMEFMKGSTLMSSSEEQKLGYLNNLFYQLAKKRFVRVDQARIVNVLKRPEIFTYFKRRMDGIKANA